MSKKTEKTSSALDIALAAVNKKHGQVLKWLSDVPDEVLEFVSTGSLSLDYALGGGLPRGRIVEIFGWESSGKSTLAMSAAAYATNVMDLRCLYIDAERALDPRLPVAYGVDPKKFILEDKPLTAEKHFSIIQDLVSSGEIGMCVVDSVSSLVPKAVMEGNVGDQHVGVLARFLSQECTKLIHLLGETNTLFVFINQYREKVVRMGDPRTTSGGNAIKFYATHRIEVSGSGKTASGAIKNDKGEVVGHRMTFKVLKNKLGVPYRSGEIDLIYGVGYDTVGELVDVGESLGLIEKAGAWYSYCGEKRQGKAGFRDLLVENESLRCEIANKLRSIMGLAA